MSSLPDITNVPDAHGHFGSYGGRFVPETLMTALLAGIPPSKKNLITCCASSSVDPLPSTSPNL